jgi:hypothetical protein
VRDKHAYIRRAVHHRLQQPAPTINRKGEIPIDPLQYHSNKPKQLAINQTTNFTWIWTISEDGLNLTSIWLLLVIE